MTTMGDDDNEMLWSQVEMAYSVLLPGLPLRRRGTMEGRYAQSTYRNQSNNFMLENKYLLTTERHFPREQVLLLIVTTDHIINIYMIIDTNVFLYFSCEC